MPVPLQILAATDLSAPSLRAVERGFHLAQATGAEYAVVHALGLDALAPLRALLGSGGASVERSLADRAGAQLRSLLDDPARNLGVAATLRVEAGLANVAVPAVAEALQADLVLIGAQGRGMARELLLASTGHRLLRQSRRPVLVVRRPAQGPYRRALIAVDFSPASALALQAALPLARDATLLLAHVLELPSADTLRDAGLTEALVEQYRAEAGREALARLHALAQGQGLGAAQYKAVVLSGHPARQLLAQAELYDCDLVVMGKHGILVTEELLLGSTTRQVLSDTEADVLVVVDERAAPARALPDVS